MVSFFYLIKTNNDFSFLSCSNVQKCSPDVSTLFFGQFYFGISFITRSKLSIFDLPLGECFMIFDDNLHAILIFNDIVMFIALLWEMCKIIGVDFRFAWATKYI